MINLSLGKAPDDSTKLQTLETARPCYGRLPVCTRPNPPGAMASPSGPGMTPFQIPVPMGSLLVESKLL